MISVTEYLASNWARSIRSTTLFKHPLCILAHTYTVVTDNVTLFFFDPLTAKMILHNTEVTHKSRHATNASRQKSLQTLASKLNIIETCAGTHSCSHSHPSWQCYFPHSPLTGKFFSLTHPAPTHKSRVFYCSKYTSDTCSINHTLTYLFTYLLFSSFIQLIINKKCRLICQLCIIVWWQVRQCSHLADESWTARRAVVHWRQTTAWTTPVELMR